MNQILVTEKLYITPEFKRKRRLYKIEFFLSVFLVCILFSYYVYAEYDRNKNEKVSQEILEQIATTSSIDTTIKKTEEDIIRIIIDDQEEITPEQEERIQEVQENSIVYTAANGIEYETDAILNIPALNIQYPVLSDTSEELLEISLNKYWGPEPNEEGNYCIVGHNYRNGKMFGTLSSIKNGDIVELTDGYGKMVKYKVYNKYVVKPTDTSCTTQHTNGYRELTLITCTNYGKERLVVKCREI